MTEKIRFTRIRIQYQDHERCTACNKPLKAGLVTFCHDEKGQDAYLGKTCAKKYTLNPDDEIPNLTRSFSSNGGQISSKTKSYGSGQTDTRKVNIEYLLLRQVILHDFTNPSYAPFETILERYDQDELTNNDHNHIRNVMNKTKTSFPSRSLQNLKNCYLMDYLIKKELGHRTKEEERTFLESILKYLHQNYKLSPKQISGALKWFRDMEDVKKKDVEKLTFTP